MIGIEAKRKQQSHRCLILVALCICFLLLCHQFHQCTIHTDKSRSIHRSKQPKGAQTSRHMTITCSRQRPCPKPCHMHKRLSVRLSSAGFTLPPALRSVCLAVEAPDSATCNPNRLEEFTVSGYMASALGRLEKHRGNATLHGFLYSIDLGIQSFQAGYYKTGVNI